MRFVVTAPDKMYVNTLNLRNLVGQVRLKSNTLILTRTYKSYAAMKSFGKTIAIRVLKFMLTQPSPTSELRRTKPFVVPAVDSCCYFFFFFFKNLSSVNMANASFNKIIKIYTNKIILPAKIIGFY